MRRTSLIHRSLARFVRNDDGATLLEYALIAALASVIILIAVLAVLGSKT
ncbi:Flp/Fap pilin component [Duganella sacchari]|uniref:Flp/Fap pilin component n=1 Tax=Duganella sacchari TaxID=551987 RepID=A0A1M7R997_9BURK|nr:MULTISPECIES: Flp family type IVb pilin [Duganella]SHN42689.1 Flp/Fap pilin component [Duganella sacchari]